MGPLRVGSIPRRLLPVGGCWGRGYPVRRDLPSGKPPGNSFRMEKGLRCLGPWWGSRPRELPGRGALRNCRRTHIFLAQGFGRAWASRSGSRGSRSTVGLLAWDTPEELAPLGMRLSRLQIRLQLLGGCVGRLRLSPECLCRPRRLWGSLGTGLSWPDPAPRRDLVYSSFLTRSHRGPFSRCQKTRGIWQPQEVSSCCAEGTAILWALCLP